VAQVQVGSILDVRYALRRQSGPACGMGRFRTTGSRKRPASSSFRFQAVATSTSGWPMDRSQIVSPGAHSYPRETLPNSTLRSPRPRHRSLHRRPGNLRLQFHLCLRGEEHVEAHLAVVVVSREGLRPSRSRLRLQRRGSIHLHQEISDGLIVGGFREVVALSKAAIQRF
jgi:hypothetical protein